MDEVTSRMNVEWRDFKSWPQYRGSGLGTLIHECSSEHSVETTSTTRQSVNDFSRKQINNCVMLCYVKCLDQQRPTLSSSKSRSRAGDTGRSYSSDAPRCRRNEAMLADATDHERVDC